MKKRSMIIYGILLMIIGFICNVLEFFGFGVTLMCIGVVLIVFGKANFKPGEGTHTPTHTPIHTPAKPPAAVSGAPAADAYTFHGTEDAYFYQLLCGCFPQMKTERDLPVSVLLGGSAPVTSWSCQCGTANTGKFCSDCGAARPVTTPWVCSCGHKNTGKFCADCGKKRPAGRSDFSADHSNDSYFPATFVLCQNSQPRVAILLCDNNSWNRSDIRHTMEACQKAGIPCLRFISGFRHRSDYVVDRINKALH